MPLESPNPWLETKRQLLIAPRALRYVFAIAFFSMFGLTGSGAMLIPFFIDEFQYTDVEANTMRALMVVSYIVLSLITGAIFDRIGPRVSLIAGGVFGVIGSVVLALARDRVTLTFGALVFVPLSLSFVSPVILILLKRYSFEGNRRVVFLLAYLIKNIGAGLSYDFVDVVRDRFLETESVVIYHQYQATAARVIFLVGALSTLLGSVIAAYGIENLVVDGRGEIIQFTTATAAAMINNVEAAPPLKSRRCCGLIIAERKFAALAVFSIIMAPAMKLFAYWNNLFPKASVRELGESAKFGFVSSINAWMIVLLLVPWSHLLRRYALYKKLIAGTAMASISMFILAAPAGYATYISAQVIFTLFGEMVFSPHVDEFATQFMATGHEGVYSSLTSLYLVAPNFLGDVFAGELLAKYCPASGERQCWAMWVIIGLSGLLSTVGLIFARRFLLSRLDEKQNFEDTPTSAVVSPESATEKRFVIVEKQRSADDDNEDVIEMMPRN